jgi:hypothetical protein
LLARTATPPGSFWHCSASAAGHWTHFEEERAYLFGIGIPAGFFPALATSGRGDLT